MSYTNGLDKPTDYFNTKLYTGDGSASNRSLTGLDFSPDLVWNKSRSNAYNHYLFDSVRGAGQLIFPNDIASEQDKSAEFISFDSNGFTVKNDAGSLAINASSVTFANWCWKKSTTSGFDIVLYTGNASGSARAISHSLGTTPAFMITKHRAGTQTTGTNNWNIFHKSFSAGDYIHFTSGAKLNASQYWGNTLPTSSNFYVGGDSANVHNESGVTYVAYLFGEKKGYSKFGSYTGNGSSDGSYIHLGFKPAWVMIKRTDTSGAHWVMHDTKRDPFNVMDKRLWASLSNAETTDSIYNIDFLSNGLKIRNTNTLVNASGGTYILMAFASEPFTTSTGIPTTAR